MILLCKEVQNSDKLGCNAICQCLHFICIPMSSFNIQKKFKFRATNTSLK